MNSLSHYSALTFALLMLLSGCTRAENRRPMVPLSRATEPALNSETEFSFAVMGDCRSAFSRAPLPRVFHDIVRDVALLRPAFVLFAGDAIYGYGQTRQHWLNEYDRFRAAVAPAGIPFYNAPGNHEMQSEAAAVEVLKQTGQMLYGSFNIGKYHFIALNTDEIDLEQRVTGEQFEWLKSDLESHKDATGIFIWMHRPLDSWYRGDFNPDDRDALRALFKKYPVKAVFAGHDHYFDTSEVEGIRYFTSGGAGSPVYTEPQKGGFPHYILVSVSPTNIDYNVITPNLLEVAYTAGNDGVEPVTTARVVNGTTNDLLARHLQFRVPRLSAQEHYKISTDLRDDENRPVKHRAVIRRITDNQDGSVTLGVEVGLPSGQGLYVTVEAREPVGTRPAPAPPAAGSPVRAK